MTAGTSISTIPSLHGAETQNSGHYIWTPTTIDLNFKATLPHQYTELPHHSSPIPEASLPVPRGPLYPPLHYNNVSSIQHPYPTHSQYIPAPLPSTTHPLHQSSHPPVYLNQHINKYQGQPAHTPKYHSRFQTLPMLQNPYPYYPYPHPYRYSSPSSTNPNR
ncbi:hypothetical protein M422DRAFT_48606 [Sphaerobolus stellatus SS14]|uniref:Uncharacterized protein n=1 Tax=Sphaerobolus stellatus (strain SS14) TaxID=990650 RepID=A0A0C9UEX2_SPHS4|nr:hypothetical protein M422DRAFT_48606 [Sphaerobolus stellatus SS14]